MNYCTYFDKNYLLRGLALYDSLLKNTKKKFHLYVIAFDEFTYIFLKKKNLKYITCVYYEDFENEQLKKVKKNRTKLEYLWTCTPSIILFFIKNYRLSSCIYIDADIYFFSNPEIIYKKNSNHSVLITSHNYHPQYDQSRTSGKYCVQYLLFKNTLAALKVLNWWKKKCIDWCYNKFEDDKFGDQKYLDLWPSKFTGVKVSKNLGLGVAPWNIKRFSIKKNTKILIIENYKNYELIFYHFHDLKFFFNKKVVFLGSYDLSIEAKNIIYKPYLKKIISLEKKYKLNFDENFKKIDYFQLYKLVFNIKLIIKFMINYKNFKIL